MASKRVTCGEASGWFRCRKPAQHAGLCDQPPTARERRLLALLKRARWHVDYCATLGVDKAEKLLAAIDRETARGKERRGK